MASHTRPRPTVAAIPATSSPFALSLRRATRFTAFYPLVGLIVVSIVMVFASNSFLSASNISNILRQVSINALIAVGMTYVILTGGIDLSVGAVMALAGTLAAGLMAGGMNGVLATMGIARGLGLIYTGGYPISGLPQWINWFGEGSVLGLQAPIFIMIVVYILGWVLLERTPFGRYVYAIGGNETATRLSGVRVARSKLIIYAISGFTAAIAAVVLTGRLMSGQPNSGQGFELDAIAAVVLGGTSIAGGRGSLIGTLLGALLLGVLNNGLNMVGVNPYVQTVVKGAIILLAIYIGRERRKTG